MSNQQDGTSAESRIKARRAAFKDSFSIPNDLLSDKSLTISARMLAVYLLSIAGDSRDESTLTREYLAHRLMCSESTIDRGIAELKARRGLRVRRVYGVNCYDVRGLRNRVQS